MPTVKSSSLPLRSSVFSVVPIRDIRAIRRFVSLLIFPRNLAPDFTHYFSERPEMSSQLLHAMSRQRKYQLRHKRAGLCYDCSRPVASSTLFCELHRRQRNLINRERQRKRYKRKIRYFKAESYGFSNALLA